MLQVQEKLKVKVYNKPKLTMAFLKGRGDDEDIPLTYTSIKVPTHQLSNDKVNILLESLVFHKRTSMLPNCLIDGCRNARCIQAVQLEVTEEDTTRGPLHGLWPKGEEKPGKPKGRKEEPHGPSKGGAWAKRLLHGPRGTWPKRHAAMPRRGGAHVSQSNLT